ncbi:MAG: hypothetical protein DMG80_04240 [Acidobacteria bacterium]|jgi:hypothetical protein|nr:MAG: hypothetical protein DMG80_04240 [Acidobacteriota bacterium]
MGSMKAILGIVLMVAVAIVCIKLIPPYFSNYEFEDSIKNEALQSTYGSRTENDIRDSVIKHAREYDIQLTIQQVKVSRSGNSGTGTLSIEANYTVPLSFPGYSTTLEFHPSSSNKGIY